MYIPILFDYIHVSNYTFISNWKTELDIHYTKKKIRVLPHFKEIQIKMNDTLPTTIHETIQKLQHWKTIQKYYRNI